MKIASLRGHQLHKNLIFNRTSHGNRDNCYDPYILLKNKFKEHDIDLNTSDLNHDKDVLFEIHQDAQLKSKSKNNYLMMFETSFIGRLNKNKKILSQYKKIFTWCDDHVDQNEYIKFNFPNPIIIPEINGFRGRDEFCCMIAGNKSAFIPKVDNLYIERVNTIKWFELNYPSEFNLYGIDWDLPVVPAGVVGKIVKELYKFIFAYFKKKPFPSYKGKIKHKSEVLRLHRFSICYENVANQNGYITEKIFDSFFSGCVPVYWGASNITDYIPSNCFIDRRHFPNHEALYFHLKSIDENLFIEYQNNIISFLNSQKAYQFSSEYFAHKIVEEILNDLGI